jgi:F420-dependent oxidoreductase-like protein
VRRGRLLMAYFDLHIADFRTEGGSADLFERVVAAAEAAERAGFDAVSVMDHVHQIAPYMVRSDPIPEAYVLLGALAARTRRIRLGTLVTAVTYRNPALLAKMVTTLDVVSGGRAYLGIGASWNEDEYRAYGFGNGLLPIRERLDRLEEALEVCRAMFTGDEAHFQGRYYRLDGALNIPRPVQPGGPPILVGGAGERRLLRLVARYADIANVFGDPATVRHKLSVLERHCEQIGRDPAEILKTHTGMVIVAPSAAEAERRAATARQETGMDVETFRSRCITGDPDEVAEQAQPLLDAGLDGLMFFTRGLWTPEDVALAGEAITKLRVGR